MPPTLAVPLPEVCRRLPSAIAVKVGRGVHPEDVHPSQALRCVDRDVAQSRQRSIAVRHDG
jgi:hypothetical protein